MEKHADCQRVKIMNLWIKWTVDLNPCFTIFFSLLPKSKNTFALINKINTFKVCLDTIYFVENEKLLLKVL